MSHLNLAQFRGLSGLGFSLPGEDLLKSALDKGDSGTTSRPVKKPSKLEKMYGKGKVQKALLKKLTADQRYTLAQEVLSQRGSLIDAAAQQTKSEAVAQSATETAAATSQSKLLSALPWVLGGIAGLVVLVSVAKKGRSR